MKKLVLILAIAFSLSMNAQTINGKTIDELNVKYIELVGETNLPGNKTAFIGIDFGQQIPNRTINSRGVYYHKGMIFKDVDGENVKFITIVDAINFLTDYGFRLKMSCATANGNHRTYHYILHKK